MPHSISAQPQQRQMQRSNNNQLAAATDPSYDCAAEKYQHLVEDNLGLAASIAARHRNKGVDFEDLRQVAFLGLVSAAQRYRPDAGRFSAFASVTISGEIKKYFRDHAWSIRPPRRIQNLKSALTAHTWHSQLTGPQRNKLAQRHDVTAGEISEALACSTCYHSDSLDEPNRFGGTTRSELIADNGDDFDHCEKRLDLGHVLASLADSDRELIQLRFYEDLSQQEIATRLGVSQMQVSRRLASLMNIMRERLVATDYAVEAA